MALNYNLAKVYAISENDEEFVHQIVSLFVSEVPTDLLEIKQGIKDKNYRHVYGFAHKIKPTLDLLGMSVGFQEVLFIEDWTKREGKKKEIKETYKGLQKRVERAVKEISKDFNL